MIALSLEHYKELKKKEWVQILHCPFPSWDSKISFDG
jgi:hypothetical protein